MSEVRKGYKMTGLGEIPSEWEIIKFGEIGEAIIGLTYSPDDLVESSNLGTLVLRSSNIKNGKLDFRDSKFVKKAIPNKLLTKQGDILICARNGSKALIGKSVLITEDVSMTFGAFMMIIRSDMNQYLNHYFQSQFFKKQIFSNSTATINQITTKDIVSFKVIVPSRLEQQKIASILSTVDEQIDETEQLIVKMKELKKGLMQQLLTNGIGHTKFKQTELGAIPVEWEVVKLKDFTELITKGTTPTTLGYNFQDKGINYIKNENISDNGKIVGEFLKISEECNQALSRSIIKEDDLLVSIVGSLGKSAIVNKEFTPANTNQNLAIVRVIKGQLEPKFLSFLFMSSVFERYVRLEQTIAVQPSMSLKQIGDFLILLPPLKEQKKIAQILSTVDSQITAYEQEKAKYEELKKGLMQQLLTGQIRVKI